jgi:hypothetical protein
MLQSVADLPPPVQSEIAMKWLCAKIDLGFQVEKPPKNLLPRNFKFEFVFIFQPSFTGMSRRSSILRVIKCFHGCSISEKDARRCPGFERHDCKW